MENKSKKGYELLEQIQEGKIESYNRLKLAHLRGFINLMNDHNGNRNMAIVIGKCAAIDHLVSIKERLGSDEKELIELRTRLGNELSDGWYTMSRRGITRN
jgi:hypothetical protein